MQKIFDKNKNIVYNKLIVIFCCLFFGGGVNKTESREARESRV